MTPDPYEHKEFPKMLYSSTGATMVVHTEEDLAELKVDGWAESPAEHGVVETADPAEQRRKQLAEDRAKREAKVREQRDAQAKADAEAKAKNDDKKK